jgi:hypothetical protein
MTPVTDPAILAQLEGTTPQVPEMPNPGIPDPALATMPMDGIPTTDTAPTAGAGLRPVEDPAVLKQLTAGDPKTPATMPDGSAIPDEGVVLNTLAGFNREFAKAIGAPAEIANEVLNLIGTGMWDPKDRSAQNKVLEGMRKIGIKVDAVDGLAKQVGEEFFTGMVTLATMSNMGGLATKAGQAGWEKTSRIMSDMVEAIRKNPALATLGEFGAATGGVVAKDATGSDLAAIPGAIAGGSMVTAAANTASKVLRRGGDLASSVNPFRSKAPQQAPLRDPYAEVEAPRQFAEEQVEGAKLRMERELNSAIESVDRTTDSATAQTIFRQRFDEAEKIATRMESAFWQRVDTSQRVPMSNIKRSIESMQDDMVDVPRSAVPSEKMEEIYSLSQPVKDPETGRMVPSLPTIKKLRGIRSELRVERKTEEAAPAPNNMKIANLNRLERIIDDGIAAQFPDDVTLAQARAMSTKYHDLFSRGPAGVLSRQRAQGDELVPPSVSVDRLRSQPQGLESVNQINRGLNTQRAPGGRNFAVTSQERQTIQQMVVDAENAIRTQFREAADQSPEQAAAYLKKNEASIKPLARVSSELEFVGQKLNAVMDEQKIIQKSALARFSQLSPDVAIQRIFSHPNPVSQVKELQLVMKRDPDALV